MSIPAADQKVQSVLQAINDLRESKMIIDKSPDEWEAPEWHEDFGDPQTEIEELRLLAIAICKSKLCTTFNLEIPEPGFIEVSAVLPNSSPAKMLLAPSTAVSRGRRFAIFLYPDSEREIETYLDSVDAVVSFLTKHGCVQPD